MRAPARRVRLQDLVIKLIERIETLDLKARPEAGLQETHPVGFEGDANLMHLLIDCANAYATVGEMVSALKAVWGEFVQPVVF